MQNRKDYDIRITPSFIARGTQTCCQIVSIPLSICIFIVLSSFSFLVEKSASNDFWGKTFINLFGESKMTQNISILTGCSAGATVSDSIYNLQPLSELYISVY